MSDSKIVIVTGAGTGIGAATARRFAEEGARVLAVGRTKARLDETADGYPGIRPFVADVAAEQGPEEIVAAAVAEFGGLDVLVNNAAIIRPEPLATITRSLAEQQLATNLLGPVFLARAAVPHLRAAKGVIVNVTSNEGSQGWPGNSIYGSTKVSLDFLTRTWAVELAGAGIRVVSVAPGLTSTPILEHAGFDQEQIAESGQRLLSLVPLGRRAEPAEIAWWIVRMTGEEAAYVTGQVLRVDGGINVAALGVGSGHADRTGG